MHVAVNGTRLWFDVEGPVLVPDGGAMRLRPTLVLVHGGPGGYDHSYLKPHFGRLAAHAQVVYLDLRDHGRSEWGDPSAWTLEACADDVRAFCDALGIERPVVLGHSMGAPVVLLYGARHPGHAGGLVALSGFARFDLDRLVEGVRSVAGDEVAELARRSYSGDPVGEQEWPRVFAAFGPHLPDADTLARRRRNVDVGAHGGRLTWALDIREELRRIDRPTLVCVGALDVVTPVAASEEILAALPAGVGRLDVLPDAGHFPWLDVPERLERLLASFVGEVGAA